ncbi:hypothetical protein GUITHDRAFT_114073 [Guillardia theta CCMP2712]|uniref:EF-hand domain-containing protein n=1 Tax=Guillardia theta (strain CCMP2712) TaxID=905079 RepID=L1IUR7_GUITC|nr:hypothetical protein GUITHDRAFT_114073 [Guillardia theta CCMP2712]EKX39822.1 hypothetical protein GUITHDRAFT_114073 [Guillardia theta CCMP2712]|eukprot:XP_005826802.1 hypothetical protein GUITHDRAFT_114073 [Guillardia theta CCMP2712]
MDKDGDGKVSTEEFLEHAQKQASGESSEGVCTDETCSGHHHASHGEGGESAAGMPTKEEIEAAKAEVAAAVAKGLPIEMTNANTAAILDCTSNIFVKLPSFFLVCQSVSCDMVQ